jgi:hypothetical protein
MRRVTLLLAAGLLSLTALLPVTARAQTTLIENVSGAEYWVGTCLGGQTGSFAGVGSPSAFFNTTICHTTLTSEGKATILPGGGFQLATSQRLLVGQYAPKPGTTTNGTVGPGHVTSYGYFCTEVFPVTAYLGPASSKPTGATNIITGTAYGWLTHVGVTAGPGCNAFAASIKGVATLTY